MTTVTTTTNEVIVNVSNGVPVFVSGLDIQREEGSSDFVFEFSDDYWVWATMIKCVDPAGATVSMEKLVGTSDIMIPTTLVENQLWPVFTPILPTDTEDSDDTTVYVITDGAIELIIYKLPL